MSAKAMGKIAVKLLLLGSLFQVINAQDSALTTSKKRTSDWDKGFCETITIKNSGNEDKEWKVTIPVDGKIYDLWNANYTQDSDLKLTAWGVDWNKIVKAHSSVEFGYCANKVANAQSKAENNKQDDSQTNQNSQENQTKADDGSKEDKVKSQDETKQSQGKEQDKSQPKVDDSNSKEQSENNKQDSSSSKSDSNGLTVTKDRKSDWDKGFCEDVIIKNSSNQDKEWKVTIPVDGKIYNLWNANYTQDSDLKLTAWGVDWNKIVKAHSSVKFGYCANKVDSNQPKAETNQQDKAKKKAQEEAQNKKQDKPQSKVDDESKANQQDKAKKKAQEEAQNKKQDKPQSKVDDESKAQKQAQNSAQQDVNLDARDLSFNAIKGNNQKPGAVASDLNLITKGKRGTDIKWQSNKPNIIAPNGKVTRPKNSNQVVTLTATISKDKFAKRKRFRVRVLKAGSEQEQSNTNSTDDKTTDNSQTKPDTTDNSQTKPDTTDNKQTQSKTTENNQTQSDTTDSEQTQTDLRYSHVLGMALKFYEAQRGVGPFPTVKWRKPASTHDGSDVGVDLNGGWFDAGDYVKFNQPMSYAVTMLNWSMIKDREAYVRAGQLEYGKDQVKYALDYLLKTYNPGKDLENPADDKVYYQVADPYQDHSAGWIMPQEIKANRPTFTCDANKRCSAISAQMAASFASGSILFADDEEYSSKLLANAKRIFKFAESYQGDKGSNEKAAPFYTSQGYKDELGLASMWLYKATGDKKYLDKAKMYVEEGNDPTYWALSWENVNYETRLLLFEETKEQKHAQKLEQHINNWINNMRKTQAGYRYLDGWGSMRYNANGSFVALAYSQLINDKAKKERYIKYAKSQMDYILGDNPTGFSFVVGYGDRFPTKVHHRAATGFHDEYSKRDNLYVIEGALIGGFAQPDDYDYEKNGKDNRGDYQRNEVAVDYNAAFTADLAMLAEIYGDK